jgi:hypothetical protein
MAETVQVALWVRLKLSRGRKAGADFLRGTLALVEQEPAKIAGLGVQLGPSTFPHVRCFPE